MAKRKSATIECSSGEATTRTRRRTARLVAQEPLPGMATTGPEATRAARRPASAATRSARAQVTLQVAPTNGPRKPARVRQQPATDATPAPVVAPAEPKETRKGGNKRLDDLREALSDGWEIIQPIFARPLWSATDDSQTAYNFVLRREQGTRLMTVPGSRTVERFIETHGLAVDYRR